MPASNSPTLPRKPDSGGTPARFIAGMKNRIASTGDAAASPPSRASTVVPATRSISPTARNSAVCTRMWCAT